MWKRESSGPPRMRITESFWVPVLAVPGRAAAIRGILRIKEDRRVIGSAGEADEKFTPCNILKKHARDGTKFYEEY